MRSLFYAAFCLLLSATVSAQNFSSPHFEIKQLQPNVYAAIARPGGYAICNAGIIDLGQNVLIFDPFITPQAAADLKRFIDTRLHKPVAYVINSHYHNDHIRGNQVFKNAIIISTTATARLEQQHEPEEIADEKQNAPGWLKAWTARLAKSKTDWEREEAQIFKGYYEGMLASHAQLVTTLPTLLFDDSITIRGNQTMVQLKSFGTGHTESDLFMYLPNEHIAFMGDLLFTHFHPYVGDGNITAWIGYLKKVDSLNITTFVPGHGDVGDTSSLTSMIGYLDMLRQIAAQFNGTMPTDDAISAALPPPYKDWHLAPFFKFNVQAAIEQARGASNK